MRKRGEPLLERALEALSRALTKSGAPWMVIGGIAIAARGVARFTTDIDACVRGDAIDLEQLVALLGRHRISPRIADALNFARANLVLLLRHAPTGVDLDVSLAWSAFEHDALAASTPTAFGAVRVPVCMPADLVVFKAIASRPKDIDDASALLDLYPDIDVARARRRVEELSVLAEEPQLLTTFDAMVASARGTRRRRPARKKKRRTKKRRIAR